MIRTRSRKIWRDIQARKLRTLLVAISIFIGVFGVVTLFSAGEILVNQLRSDLKEDRLAMIRTVVTSNSDTPVDNQTALDTLRALPGVSAVEGRAVYPLFWKQSDADPFEKAYIVAYTTPFGDALLEPPRLVEGDFPVQGQGQVAVEQRMADDYGLAVGDSIDLRILGTDQGDTIPQETWTISGIVFQPYGELTGTVADSFAPDTTLVFATYTDAQHIASFRGLSAIYARYGDFPTAEREHTAFQAAIAAHTSYVPVSSRIEDPAQNSYVENTRATNNVLLMLALVALIVSGFLVINVVNSIVVEQKRQIGLMKSLGATGWDNLVIYSGIAFTYGVLGALPGVLLGIPGGYLAAKGLATQNNTVIDTFAVSPRGIILGLLVGLGVPLLASLWPVFNGTRVHILAAMSDYGIDARYSRGPLQRLIAALPLPLTLRQAMNNVNQKKFRLALTGTTLTVAAGAFMGIFAVFSSLSSVVDDIFDTFGTHFSIVPSEGQDYATVRDLILPAVSGIQALDPGARLAVEIEGYTPLTTPNGAQELFVLGIDPHNPDMLQLNLREGSAWNEDPARKGVAVNARIADTMGKQVGDTLVINAGGNQAEFEIIGIVNYPFDSVWFSWEELATLGGLVDANGQPYPNELLVIMAQSDPSGREVQVVIDEVNDVLLANGITAEFINWAQFNEEVSRFLVAFQVILYLAAALIAAVGALGLLTSLSMSVFERQKEIGVMRSVGASASTVAVQFVTEGMTVGIIAWLFGIPLSYLLSLVLVQALNFGDVFDLSYPLITLVVGLAGMIVVVLIASILPALSAARKTVSDILRYQ